jgi:hypothetical protein
MSAYTEMLLESENKCVRESLAIAEKAISALATHNIDLQGELIEANREIAAYQVRVDNDALRMDDMRHKLTHGFYGKELDMNRNARGNERSPSPTVSFYQGDNAVGNAMGSMADREGNNSGRKEQYKGGIVERLRDVLDAD